jgi:lipid A 3-O-deacylase
VPPPWSGKVVTMHNDRGESGDCRCRHGSSSFTNVRMKMILTLCAAAILGGMTSTPQAHAGGMVHEYKFGVLAHDIPHIWSGFRLERGMGFNAEAIFTPSVSFLGGHIRPAAGASLAIQSDGSLDSTSKVYAGARWVYDSPRGWFAGVGLGAALHSGKLDASDPERKALGSRVLFHIPFEVGLRFEYHHSVSLYFDHISNGGTRSANEGLDTLGIRYGYRY